MNAQSPSVRPGRLDGLIVVVTGAAGGLGRATATRLAAEGARLVLTDLDEAGLKATVAALGDQTPLEVVLAGDLTDPAFCDALAEHVATIVTHVDGVCNVAGISPAVPFDQTTPELFDRIMSINCKGQMLMIQAFLPLLRAADGASIVNISSVGGRVALPALTVYGASKAAVLGLTRGVALELAPDGIRCNAVCPGGINTPMADAVVSSFADPDVAIRQLTGRQIMKRFAEPAEIAGLIAFLVSPESSFLTGSIIDADAGHTSS